MNTLVKHLKALPKKLGIESDMFILRLGITNEEHERLKKDYPSNIEQQVETAIRMWIQRKTGNCLDGSMKKKLLTALSEANRADLHEMVRDGDWTDRWFLEFAPCIGAEWKELGTYLGIDMPTLQRIEMKYSHDPSLQTFKALVHWRKNQYSDSIAEALKLCDPFQVKNELIQVLKDCGRSNIVEEMKKSDENLCEEPPLKKRRLSDDNEKDFVSDTDECLEKNLTFRRPDIQKSSDKMDLDNSEVNILTDETKKGTDGDIRSNSAFHLRSGYSDEKCGNIPQKMEDHTFESTKNTPLNIEKVEEKLELGSDSDGGDSDYDKSEREVVRKSPVNKLRSYQQELADKALQGKNTIICADTNSGKTRVALYIANRILKSPACGNRKVVFMARTNPLVQQQFKLFQTYLPKYKVCLLSKEDINSTKMNLVMMDYHVFFLTPQILVNNLKAENISMTMFALLILDECHHTDKGEPYNTLMRQYIKDKTKKPCVPRPQV